MAHCGRLVLFRCFSGVLDLHINHTLSHSPPLLTSFNLWPVHRTPIQISRVSPTHLVSLSHIKSDLISYHSLLPHDIEFSHGNWEMTPNPSNFSPYFACFVYWIPCCCWNRCKFKPPGSSPDIYLEELNLSVYHGLVPFRSSMHWMFRHCGGF